MDSVEYFSIISYLLQVWDITSDMLFCQTVYKEYIRKDKNPKLLVILLASIAFIVIPWALSMYYNNFFNSHVFFISL